MDLRKDFLINKAHLLLAFRVTLWKKRCIPESTEIFSWVLVLLCVFLFMGVFCVVFCLCVLLDFFIICFDFKTQ